MAAIGERVGPFKLTGRLESEGGLELWDAVRADDTLKDPRQVWVRLVTSDDPAHALRLRHEYEALRVVEDPRVPSVVGFFAGHGALAITRHEGVSLRWAMRAAEDGLLTIEPATALDIALEVAHALRAGHSILSARPRIVHGALTPDSVRIGPGGILGVTGLGAAMPCPGNYLAPECLAGEPPSLASDQWQLGALLFELLTGRPLVLPLPLPTMRKDPGRHLDVLDPGDQRLLQRMLADKPEDRFPVDRELLQALHQRARELGGTSLRDRLYERVMAQRERLEDPTEVPEGASDELSSGEQSSEVSVSLAIQQTLDLPTQPLPELDLEEPQPEEIEATQPLPRPTPPAPEEAPRSLLGEWTVLLSFFLFVVCALWFVLTRVL